MLIKNLISTLETIELLPLTKGRLGSIGSPSSTNISVSGSTNKLKIVPR